MANPPIDFTSFKVVPRYAIYQLEVGAEGTPHLQGYVVFKRPRRISAIKNDFGSNPHLDKRNGTHSQAKHYVTKPHDDCTCKHCIDCVPPLQGPWIFGSEEGIPETQGSRSDLAGVKRKLDEGATLTDIAASHFSDFVRYEKGFRSYKRMNAGHRNWEMEVIVLFGPTGTGKTRWVEERFGKSLYSVPDAKASGTYWDDYDDQDTVLIDEMYGVRFHHGFLLRLLDRYQFTVPVHGGSVNFQSKRIVMTSNKHPSEWYSKMYESTQTVYYRGPLHRRLVQGTSCIIECEYDQATDSYSQSFRSEDDYKFPLLL